MKNISRVYKESKTKTFNPFEETDSEPSRQYLPQIPVLPPTNPAESSKQNAISPRERQEEKNSDNPFESGFFNRS